MNAKDAIAIALVISTGEQDVKVWERRPRDARDRNAAAILRGRTIQKSLLDSEGSYRILLPSELQAEMVQGRVRELDIKATDPTTVPPGMTPTFWQNLVEAKNKGHVLIDDAGHLLLRPAKIENLVAQMDRLQKENEIRLARVLVYATDRMAPTEFRERHPGKNDHDRKEHQFWYEKEPFANGVMLARWLAQRFGLSYQGEGSDIADGGSGWVNMMKGLPSFEGDPNTADHPLYRRLAREIDDAMANLARGFSGYAVVSSTGGSCDAKACILASAELRFPGRTYDYPETEGGGVFSSHQLRQADCPPYVVPTRSLTARAQCATLVRQGDPLGAWGAVAHLSHLDSEQDWIPEVRYLQNFLGGGSGLFQLLPGDTRFPPQPEIERILQQAFQVEAALQGRPEDRRIPAALMGLTALAEHTLYIHITRAVPELLGVTIDPASGALPTLKEQGTKLREGVKAALKQARMSNQYDGQILGRDDDPPRINVFGSGARCWRRWLCAQADLRWRRVGESIERFESFLRTPGDVGPNQPALVDYRHWLAHAVLTQAEEQHAFSQACQEVVFTPPSLFPGDKAGPLWSFPDDAGGDDDQSLGGRFLASSLTTELLEPLGIRDPAGIYRDLMRAVLAPLHGSIQTD